MKKYLLVFAILGALPPIMVFTGEWFRPGYIATASPIAKFHIEFLLVAWPSWIGLMAIGEQSLLAPQTLSIFAALTAVNVMTYTALGWCIWFGIYRQHWTLLVTLVVVGVGLYSLLQIP